LARQTVARGDLALRHQKLFGVDATEFQQELTQRVIKFSELNAHGLSPHKEHLILSRRNVDGETTGEIFFENAKQNVVNGRVVEATPASGVFID